jgi:hypothetical protein
MAVTINGTSGVTFNDASVQGGSAVGYSQTWQNVFGSRALGTTYTNSTGRPIMVAAIATRLNTTTLVAVVSGVTVAIEAGTGASANANTTLCFIVPNGGTYSVTNTGGSTLGAWAELR